MSDQPSTPRCPYCGFTIFTNRYPKCERCDRQLPSDMVLSRVKLEALLAREREERERRAQSQRRKEGSGPILGSYPLQSGVDQNLVDGLLDLGSSLPDIEI